MAPPMTQAQMVMQNQASEADSLASEIQFGIELEFFAPPNPVWTSTKSSSSKYKKFVQNSLERDHVYHYLADSLQRAGLQGAYIMETADSDCDDNELRRGAPNGSIIKTEVTSDMRVMNSASFCRRGHHNPLFQYWLIKWEGDITGLGEYNRWVASELNTPILREPEANTGFPSLHKAMESLENAHPSGVHVNDSCGLHVHVSPVTGLTALHAKRIATLALLLEDNLFFHLCDPHRRKVHHRILNASLLADPPAAIPTPPCAIVNLPEKLLRDMGKSLNLLWRPENVLEVGHLFHREGRNAAGEQTALGVNMHVNEDDSITNTLEFRYPEASFDQGFVDNWVCLTLTICKVAILPTTQYKEVAASIWDIVAAKPTPEASWAKLLRVLNDAVPPGWAAKSSEDYWKTYLASQDRK